VLSVGEQKSVAELQHQDPDRAAAARSPRPRRGTPWALVVLMAVSVLAVIVGAVLPGLGTATAVALGWLLLRYLPGSADPPDATSGPPDAGRGMTPASRREEP
jgi:hypothetical protein